MQEKMDTIRKKWKKVNIFEKNYLKKLKFFRKICKKTALKR